MEALQPYLTIVLILVVLVWSLRFHGWWGPEGPRRRSALWGGFSTTSASLLFLITGLLGVDLTKRGFLIRESARTGAIIWPQVIAGLLLLPLAAYLLRRGMRSIARRLQQESLDAFTAPER